MTHEPDMTKIEAPERIWIQSDHIPDEVALNKWTTKPSASEAQLFTGYVRDDYVAKLEAENKRLNEQMDSIEQMGTESLNALPDCLMRLGPALVENGELKAKLAKAVDVILKLYYGAGVVTDDMRATIAELTGEDQ